MSIFKFDEIILSNKECEYIINLSKNRWEDPSIRVNKPDRSTYFHTFKLGDDKLIDSIFRKISSLLERPIDKIKELQVNRYQVGESFPLHYDQDGTIQYTFLIYLNDGFVGGETHFPNLVTKIIPKQGRAVCWIDSVGERELEYLSLHESVMVESGEKWMMAAFIRF